MFCARSGQEDPEVTKPVSDLIYILGFHQQNLMSFNEIILDL